MQKTGLSSRRIAQLARDGVIPGAKRSASGYHFEYPDSIELQKWITKRAEIRQHWTLPRQEGFLSIRDVNFSTIVLLSKNGVDSLWKATEAACRVACIADSEEFMAVAQEAANLTQVRLAFEHGESGVECSPKTEPGVMRVGDAKASPKSHEKKTTYTRRNHQEVTRGWRDAGVGQEH